MLRNESPRPGGTGARASDNLDKQSNTNVPTPTPQDLAEIVAKAPARARSMHQAREASSRKRQSPGRRPRQRQHQHQHQHRHRHQRRHQHRHQNLNSRRDITQRIAKSLRPSACAFEGNCHSPSPPSDHEATRSSAPRLRGCISPSQSRFGPCSRSHEAVKESRNDQAQDAAQADRSRSPRQPRFKKHRKPRAIEQQLDLFAAETAKGEPK